MKTYAQNKPIPMVSMLFAENHIKAGTFTLLFKSNYFLIYRTELPHHKNNDFLLHKRYVRIFDIEQIRIFVKMVISGLPISPASIKMGATIGNSGRITLSDSKCRSLMSID
jgi:hypothetical protein